MDPVVTWIARAGLAVLFALAAFHKLRDPRAFVAVVRGYRIGPEAAAPGLAALAACAELALFVCLPLPAVAVRAALAAALLLLLYSAAIGLNLVRGRRAIDCGCLGPAGSQPLSAWLLWRNGLLVGGALLAAWPVGNRPGGWVDALSIGAGLLSLALLFYAANVLAAQSVGFGRPAGRPS